MVHGGTDENGPFEALDRQAEQVIAEPRREPADEVARGGIDDDRIGPTAQFDVQFAPFAAL